MFQSTIKRQISFKGIGIHSGKEAEVALSPASNNSGIVFIKDGIRIPALAENVTSLSRGTSVGNIGTVEHLLCAISCLGIDDIEITVEGPEIPILDGSASGFISLLSDAGKELLTAEKNILKIGRTLRCESGDSFIEASPSDHLQVEATIDFPRSFVGKQRADFDEDTDNFIKDVAPSRTFGFYKEVEELKKRGLAMGASPDNAIAIMDDRYLSPLRFPDELARHKIIDIIGDMALCGKKVICRICSYKAGHALNVELARRILNA